MITINITIEAELNGKLDDTGMYLKEESQVKLDNLMVALEKQIVGAGLDSVVIDYDFFDDEEDDMDILSEGLTVTEVSRNTEGWKTEDVKEGEVEEDGRKYKKN
jgi:hypothetical protein